MERHLLFAIEPVPRHNLPMHVSNILNNVIRAGVVVALLTGAAFAQLPMPGMTLAPDQRRALTPEEKEKQKALDEKYNETMKAIPDKRPSADPWSNVRSTPAASSKQRQQ